MIRAAVREIGDIPGFKIWAVIRSGSTIAERVACVAVYDKEALIYHSRPLVVMPPNASRREVEIAIGAWKSGFDRGSTTATVEIQSGLKKLLGIRDE
ncbi:hypothetical protein ABID82_004244 [Methylobacterium sp. PvP062]|uniref:Uncharacterized protein n=1 Tax=Methylobacterium radiotolerans TaxID=31998 RepID=A0ABV2NL86_9HYPH|nr:MULTISPECIES: hypothetical protein [unclassified Methylobacterium]KZC01408.1 hypothetical protein AU375_02332 [Methylobacterium radiotolerans]MBP2496006.1 hypothetical protein [Methylobacterium sp. PvP105]MBP2504123.1 hypothetical protein [Methylobacterium sp. PvP109]MCX7333088.1 hypothetical protein [Hyphomicrobiales bacterium]